MELGLSLGQDNEHEFLNLCSRCVMTLGMLSWGMATIQDHRSYMLKKKPGKTAQRHKTQKKSRGAGVFWHWEVWAQIQVERGYLVGHKCPCGPGSMSMQALGIEHPKVGLR